MAINRDIIESNFIFSLYKDLELFDDLEVDITSDYFELEASKIYFSMLSNMFNQGYRSIDEISIENYLSDKPSTRNMYESFGGYRTIMELVSIVNLDNFNKYKDELFKANILKKLSDVGFDTNKEKFSRMSTSEIYNYYEHQLNHTFIDVESDVKIEDFDITDNYLNKINEGNDLGASISSALPRLNSDMGGIRDRNVVIVSASTGVGKTSFVFGCMILPLIKQGIKTAIISNEQGLDDFRAVMLSSVLFTEFSYYKITRRRIMAGKFNEEEWDMLKKAKDFINQKYTPYLKFIKMFEYNVVKTQKVIKKLAREGFSKFVYDVFKSVDSSSSDSVGMMVELSKAFFNLADKLDISVVITQQTALYNKTVRYLNESHLSGSKQVSEIASQVIMLREVWEDEYSGGKYDIAPYNYLKTTDGYAKDETGHGIREICEINKEDRNLVVFLSKNRFGANSKTYVLKHIANYNVFQELGYCNISHTDR